MSKISNRINEISKLTRHQQYWAPITFDKKHFYINFNEIFTFGKTGIGSTKIILDLYILKNKNTEFLSTFERKDFKGVEQFILNYGKAIYYQFSLFEKGGDKIE